MMPDQRGHGSHRLLGLFPDLGECGGVQASGQVAADAMAELSEGARILERRGRSRWGKWVGAVRAARAEAGPFELCLVWHLGLLKLLPFLRRRPERVALFVHGIEAWKPLSPLENALIRRVDVLLANSERTRSEASRVNRSLAARPWTVVPLGLGEPAVSSPPAEPGPRAAMISRLDRAEDYKGHREVLRAWPRVMARVPGAELRIAGAGDLVPLLEEEARGAGCGEAVRFVGRVSEEEKAKLLEESRAFLLPSRAEGFGLVYLEAMRLGRPCLVGDRDAGREVIHSPEAGLAVDPGNQAELAEAIVRLLTPGPEWNRMSEGARRRFERQFTARHFKERLKEALRPFLAAGTPGGLRPRGAVES